MATKTDQQKSYENMLEREETAQDATLPTLARKREEEAREKVLAVYAAARDLMSTGMLQAVGYRVAVKPMDSTVGLEPAEAEVAPHLASQDFQVKTDKEKKREEFGENHGVVVHMGPVAFDRLGGQEAWCKLGDTVVFTRYAGTRVEHPPRSGIFYQLLNDEDIFGKIS